MKNLKLVVLFALVFNLVAVSCKNDDDNDNDDDNGGDTVSENVMTIDGEAYDIETGFLDGFGENSDGSFDWDITLYSDGFSVNTEENTVSGTGSYIYIDLNTNSASGLVPGTYTFSDEREEFTWVVAEGGIDFNVETGEGTIFGEATTGNGSVTITGTGSDQLIEVNILDENGNALTVSYSGVLQTL
ncbi:MAG: hypothetical protein ACI9Y7_001674 [Dokdonia sp.]|jgi:hypothetical protein